MSNDTDLVNLEKLAELLEWYAKRYPGDSFEAERIGDVLDWAIWDADKAEKAARNKP